MDESTYLSQNKYYFYETGFKVGCLHGRLVVTHTDQKAVYMAGSHYRESLTIIETVSADRRVVDLMAIIQGVIFEEKHFNNNITNSTILAMSESSFTNNQLALSYIRHFTKQTQLSQHPVAKRLILMDKHSSHLTFKWVKYCEDNDIVYFLLPLHSTHLLQPLDIGLF